jgi:uncharacterized spore protein YtfJ
MSEEKVDLEVGFAEGLKESSPVLGPIVKLLDRLNVGSVFGQPTKEGDVTVIPVAEVTVGFGYGYGSAPAGVQMEDEAELEDVALEVELEEEEGETAEGGGGGAGGRAKPVGFVKIAPEGVEYESIVDESRIAMAGIALSAWAVFWVGRVLYTLIKAVAARKQAVEEDEEGEEEE